MNGNKPILNMLKKKRRLPDYLLGNKAVETYMNALGDKYGENFTGWAPSSQVSTPYTFTFATNTTVPLTALTVTCTLTASVTISTAVIRMNAAPFTTYTLTNTPLTGNVLVLDGDGGVVNGNYVVILTDNYGATVTSTNNVHFVSSIIFFTPATYPVNSSFTPSATLNKTSVVSTGSFVSVPPGNTFPLSGISVVGTTVNFSALTITVAGTYQMVLVDNFANSIISPDNMVIDPPYTFTYGTNTTVPATALTVTCTLSTSRTINTAVIQMIAAPFTSYTMTGTPSTGSVLVFNVGGGIDNGDYRVSLTDSFGNVTVSTNFISFISSIVSFTPDSVNVNISFTPQATLNKTSVISSGSLVSVPPGNTFPLSGISVVGTTVNFSALTITVAGTYQMVLVDNFGHSLTSPDNIIVNSSFTYPNITLFNTVNLTMNGNQESPGSTIAWHQDFPINYDVLTPSGVWRAYKCSFTLSAANAFGNTSVAVLMTDTTSWVGGLANNGGLSSGGQTGTPYSGTIYGFSAGAKVCAFYATDGNFYSGTQGSTWGGSVGVYPNLQGNYLGNAVTFTIQELVQGTIQFRLNSATLYTIPSHGLIGNRRSISVMVRTNITGVLSTYTMVATPP